MASLPQMSTTLGTCMSLNKIIDPQPFIAQLFNNKKSTHFRNLVAKEHKKRIIWKQRQNEKWKARVWDEAHEALPPHSLIERTVEDFYHAFNAKDTEKLKQLLVLDDNFVYQDFLFYTPCHGLDVINLWQDLMDAMGPNIKVVVESIIEDNLMATVFWHLGTSLPLTQFLCVTFFAEWNKWKLPYTNGCRFFWFEKDKGRLVISKITGMEEFPLKPGELLLVCSSFNIFTLLV
ncbi:hypothetical protein CR513_50661, partial [Mucuna pruriens]